MSAKKRNVLVAIDFFSKSSGGFANALKTIKLISHQLGAQTKAVTVVTPDDLDWEPENLEKAGEHFADFSQKKIEKTIRKQSLEFDLPPQALLQSYRSRRLSASGVNEFARSEDSELTVVLTHSKKKSGLAPFGSFAETIASHSEVPVLAVNAKAKPLTSIQRILFATDFSDENQEAFKQALLMAKKLKAKLVLFHQFFEPVYAMAFAGAAFVPTLPQLDAIFTQQELEIKSQSKRWLAMAKSAGVDSEFVMVAGAKEPATTLLEYLADKSKPKIDLVAICPRTNPVAALILGSTARRLLSQAKQPILLIKATHKKGLSHANSTSQKRNKNQSHNRQLQRASQ